ncbi:uncharacterized protein LOC113353183 [Papaver somniferum]|uniref:uncharacterized protein LOC113353183 n=1 Tax=Papaver somniferum TaxID=3469 RepID=UPI000E705CD2|nr:uncharacterized protein LOC113353183 [Papaver somniferum]XP_026452654.1 uncharacterized protein LOC113353183 [Papaver somniferum]
MGLLFTRFYQLVIVLARHRGNLFTATGLEGFSNKDNHIIESSPFNKDKMFLSTKKFDDWENSKTFVNALEKIEAWIFSQIIEFLWWQVMEQCVGRLDMAMFNAILRESAGDNPTDHVSNPISDSRVLTVPAGNSSFGLGAQL